MRKSHGSLRSGFKRGATAATTGSLGIHDTETGTGQFVHIVDRASSQMREAFGVYGHQGSVPLADEIPLLGSIQVHGVLKPRTSPFFNRQSQADRTFFSGKFPEVFCCRLGDLDHNFDFNGK